MFAALLQRKPEKGLKLCDFMHQQESQEMVIPEPLLGRLNKHFKLLKAQAVAGDEQPDCEAQDVSLQLETQV
jgi:hypothetical protein